MFWYVIFFQRHNIIKKRIDYHGKVIEARPDGIGAPKVSRLYFDCLCWQKLISCVICFITINHHNWPNEVSGYNEKGQAQIFPFN